jgi:hypothetical protein
MFGLHVIAYNLIRQDKNGPQEPHKLRQTSINQRDMRSEKAEITFLQVFPQTFDCTPSP